MSMVPILKQGSYLVATVEPELTDRDFTNLRDAVVDRVDRLHSRGVIVDVTAMDVVDSFVARTLQDLAHMARERGAATVIVGIQPEVASVMEKMGLTLDEAATAHDLKEGVTYLDRTVDSMPLERA